MNIDHTDRDTIYGSQHVLFYKNNKLIANYWISARIYGEDNCVRLEFLEDIKCGINESFELGEFKQVNDPKIVDAFIEKENNKKEFTMHIDQTYYEGSN